MINQQTLRGIKRAIEELGREFQQTPGLLLTEDDLKCHLMAKFSRIGNLGARLPSADEGIRATAVHAEVPWFDDRDQLRLRPDITITDPSCLSIRRAMQRGIPFPRKGFHFTGDSILVELKFYRGTSGVRPRALPSIRRDLEKLNSLVERGRRLSPITFLHGMVVVFTKYAYVTPELTELAEQPNEHVSIMVRSAGLRRQSTLQENTRARTLTALR